MIFLQIRSPWTGCVIIIQPRPVFNSIIIYSNTLRSQLVVGYKLEQSAFFSGGIMIHLKLIK